MIREMDHVVLISKTVAARACSQVALPIKIDLVVCCHQHPDSDVKLATVVQKWSLDVLLNDPVPDSRIRLKDVVLDVLQVLEDADFATSIERRGLHDPHVLLTVLPRKALLNLELLASQFAIVRDKLVHLIDAQSVAFD